MPRPWVENEDGPQCTCGLGTTVKLLPNGQWAALCLCHTSEAGALLTLPPEAPDDFIAFIDPEEA